MKLKKPYEFPIRTYQKLEADPMNGILSAFSKLREDESSVIQVLLRPVDDDWQDRIKKHIRKSERKNSGIHLSWNPFHYI